MRNLGIILLVLFSSTPIRSEETVKTAFDCKKDLVSLHYDHAPDKDDGHSAAADRTILESLYGTGWIKKHVVAVSGAHGKNRNRFNAKSDAVMDAAWNDCGGWLGAHSNRVDAVDKLTASWSKTIKNGGSVWVKEGGQSDITADVLRKIKEQQPKLDLKKGVHVVQHSKWNENQTTKEALVYSKKNADYIRIRDANAYLNVKGGNDNFEEAARNHPVFGAVWKAAFHYYDQKDRLDFSDTGELLRILGLGEMSFDDFRNRFLKKD